MALSSLLSKMEKSIQSEVELFIDLVKYFEKQLCCAIAKRYKRLVLLKAPEMMSVNKCGNLFLLIHPIYFLLDRNVLNQMFCGGGV